jgi:hypothetical protein
MYQRVGNTLPPRGGFWEVISHGLIEVSGMRRKGGRYVAGFAITFTGAGGVVGATYFSGVIVTGWRELCEEGISHWWFAND